MGHGSLSLDRLGRHIVEQLGGRWHPRGAMCRCPVHDDRTPSLSVRPGNRQLLFHCFAGCDTADVISALRDRGLLDHHAEPAPACGRDRPGVTGRGNGSAAARLWDEARSIRGSPAELYLLNRGLPSTSASFRYHALTPYGRGSDAIFRPALIAAVRDESGLVAVHRTFVDPGTGKLAELPIPKRALGTLGSGAVRLAPVSDGVLGLAEGIESALAATILTGIPCWATLGTERFARVALPCSVTKLVLFLDADAGGGRAERLARKALESAPVAIEARYPDRPGFDWNDVLLAGPPSRN